MAEWEETFDKPSQLEGALLDDEEGRAEEAGREQIWDDAKDERDDDAVREGL